MRLIKNPVFVAVVLFIIVFIAYGQTLSMYFLIDDNALIYKLQHIDQTLGLWGKGLLGEGPYRLRVLQFFPFYPIFGVNPIPYFAVGFILYYLTALVLYFFTLVIARNRSIAFAAASIFAAGYIGSETMFGITNSWETNRGIIMALFTTLLYYRFLITKKGIFYLLALVLFFFSLDTVYVRAHGLIFTLIAFDLFLGCKRFSLREIGKAVVRILPFGIIYYQIYIAVTGGEVGRFGIWKIIQSAFNEGKLVPLTVPLQDIGNLFLPDVLTSRADNLLRSFITIPSGFYVGSFLAGILVLVWLFLILKTFRKKESLFRVLLFSFFFAVSNFMLFYAREPQNSLWTTHRYFSYSFVGVSIFWAVSFYLIAKKIKNEKFFWTFSALVIIVYLSLGASYQREFNAKRSLLAKSFFASFTSFVPNIPKGAVTYFDLANDNKVRGEFGSFFGGMFSEASNLAIYNPHLDYTKDFIFTYKFDDVIQMINEGNTDINKVFTFYYGDKGLIDTTQNVRELIIDGKLVTLGTEQFSSNTPFGVSVGSFTTETDLKESRGITIGENPIIKILAFNDNPSLVPSTFSFSMSVAPKLLPLPYETKNKSFDVDSKMKNKIFSYLLSQDNFKKTAVATSASFWKDQEPKFAIDNRLETSWRGHRGFWDDISRGKTSNVEYLNIDLKKVFTINQVRWVSAQRPLVPIHYRILTSIDGKTWNLAKEVISDKTLSEGTTVVDSFSPIAARFVKMEILKTYGNDGPEIKEFEVIESRFDDLDSSIVERVRQEPFSRIDNKIQYNDALLFIKQNAVMRFYFMSSADSGQDPTKYVEIPVQVDGKIHEYQVSLPATGINWTQFLISGFNFPAQIYISLPRIIYKPVIK